MWWPSYSGSGLRLGEIELLVAADAYRGAALLRLRRRAHHLRVEARDAVGRARRHVEVDVDDAELDRAELRRRRVAAHALAPRAGRLHAALLLREGKLVRQLRHDALHLLAGVLQALRQVVEARDDEAGRAAQHLGLRRHRAARQVALRAAEVDPHVLEAGKEIRVARAAEADDVEERRQALVVDQQLKCSRWTMLPTTWASRSYCLSFSGAFMAPIV